MTGISGFCPPPAPQTLIRALAAFLIAVLSLAAALSSSVDWKTDNLQIRPQWTFWIRRTLYEMPLITKPNLYGHVF